MSIKLPALVTNLQLPLDMLRYRLLLNLAENHYDQSVLAADIHMMHLFYVLIVHYIAVPGL